MRCLNVVDYSAGVSAVFKVEKPEKVYLEEFRSSYS